VSVMTSDTTVTDWAQHLVLPIMLNAFFGLIVNANTGGVLTSQGRTKLATLLSFAVQLPLTIGGVAYAVIELHKDVITVYWIQASVMAFQMTIVMAIFLSSDWKRYALAAATNQKLTPKGIPSAKLTSPAGPASPADLLERVICGPLHSSPVDESSAAVRFQSPINEKPFMASELGAGCPTAGEMLHIDENTEAVSIEQI